MNRPEAKIVPKTAGELGRNAITYYVVKIYDGKLIDDYIEECEICGSRHLSKHGTKDKIFCIVILDSGFKDVVIHRQVYQCTYCHHDNMSGKDLFYEGCEYSRVIVDQCLALAAHNPANRVETLMMQSGIQVDERTVLRYIKQFWIKIVERNPLKLGDANVGVNLVEALFGKKTIEELQQEYPEERFAAGADEVYPRQKGAIAKHSSEKVLAEALNHDAPAPANCNDEKKVTAESSSSLPPPAKKQEEQQPSPVDEASTTEVASTKEEEKNNPVKGAEAVAAPKKKKKTEEDIVKYNKFPDSFTLALAYVTTLKFYASIVCRKVSFKSLLAAVLFQPLRGASCAMTDGSPIYNHLADDRCFFHFIRNFFKRDPAMRNFRRGKPPPASSIVASEYMRDLCQIVRAEYLSHLMAKHPDLVVEDEESGELRYVGPTTTSAVEGVNHRMKYELRVPYKDMNTFFGRVTLAAITDSVYTFRNGRPEVSFAQVHSSFSYSSVMTSATGAGLEDESSDTTTTTIPRVATTTPPLQTPAALTTICVTHAVH